MGRNPEEQRGRGREARGPRACFWGAAAGGHHTGSCGVRLSRLVPTPSFQAGSGPAAVRGGVQTLTGKGLCPQASLRQGHTRGQARVLLFPDQPRATGQDPPTLNSLGDRSTQVGHRWVTGEKAGRLSPPRGQTCPLEEWERPQPALHWARCSERSLDGPLGGLQSRGHTCQRMGTGGLFLCRVGARACGGSSGTGPDCLLLQGGGDAATQGGIHTQNLALGSLAPRGESSLPLQDPSAPGACGRAAQAAGGRRRPSALGRPRAAVLAKSGAGTTGGGSEVRAARGEGGGGPGRGGSAGWLSPAPGGRWDVRRAVSVWQLHFNVYLKALKISATIKPPLPREAGVYWEPRVGGAGASPGWWAAGPSLAAGLPGLLGTPPTGGQPPASGSPWICADPT